MANNSLELWLEKTDYNQDTSELTVFVYQYLMPNMQKIQEEKPIKLEKVFKFKLFIVKERTVSSQSTQLGELITIKDSISDGLMLSPFMREDIVL